MTAKAKLTPNRRAKALRRPKELHFPGTAVALRPSEGAAARLSPPGDLETRRRRFLKLAGSCPDFPETSRHPALDVPRVFAE